MTDSYNIGSNIRSNASLAVEDPLMQLKAVGFHINERGLRGASNHTPSISNAISGKSKPKVSRIFGSWLDGAKSEKSSHKGVDSINTVIALPSHQVLLNNINLDILPYEKMSVIGPNGAGKSTLMKLLLGLLTPTSGSIIRNPKLELGYVPQKFSVPTILPLRVKDLLAQTKTRLNHDEQAFLYERLSVHPLLNKQVTHLSGGETQRILLARSLLSKPNLLILDEPMQGLDPDSERWLYEFIDDLPDFLQCAMVVVSHDLHWVMRGSRRVICLNKHICCEGRPSDLEVSQEFIKLFGHQYEQPYIHRPHECQHHRADTL